MFAGATKLALGILICELQDLRDAVNISSVTYRTEAFLGKVIRQPWPDKGSSEFEYKKEMTDCANGIWCFIPWKSNCSVKVVWGLLLNELLERKWADSLGHTRSQGWLGGWVLFSHGLHWVSSDYLYLKWKFLAEIMTCGPNFAEDYVTFYTASRQANLQRHNYQIRTGKQCQAAIQIKNFGF